MNKAIRCAIYTRKSSEEGLDMEFNSLDAQREAGESYIKSQKHEGWEVIKTQYNDGGYSGGNVDRPALKQLLSDIESGKIDVVVVYKVDRLSRSLSDFARLVETFDKYTVSFVSVTQQFNTTTSMGRLTLNILLSFAQFEREVTGERIRDKFRASKEKGMWMGGTPPLGYDINLRNLVINEQEAELVRYIYAEYLKVKSVVKLLIRLNKEGHKTKQWKSKAGKITGGKDFGRMTLYRVLCDSVYIGKIEHKNKNKIYDGQQQPIIDQELWAKVQQQLKSYRPGRTNIKTRQHNYLLRGKCFDIDDRPYTTTYANKGKSKKYGYYHNTYTKHWIGSIQLERIIIQSVQASLINDQIWLQFLGDNSQTLIKEQILSKLQKIFWDYDNLSQDQKNLIGREIIERIIIMKQSISLKLSKAGIDKIIKEVDIHNKVKQSLPVTSKLEIKITGEYLEITIPISFRSAFGRKLAFDASGKPVNIMQEHNTDMTLIKALGKSYKWSKMLESGEVKSAEELVRQENSDIGTVSRTLRLLSLSPDIIESILNGTQSPALSIHQLRKPIPYSWTEQRQLFA